MKSSCTFDGSMNKIHEFLMNNSSNFRYKLNVVKRANEAKIVNLTHIENNYKNVPSKIGTFRGEISK
jgi:hypothetical protein